MSSFGLFYFLDVIFHSSFSDFHFLSGTYGMLAIFQIVRYRNGRKGSLKNMEAEIWHI